MDTRQPEPASSRRYSPSTPLFSSLRSGSWVNAIRSGSSKVITSVKVVPIDLPRTGTLVTFQVQRSSLTSMRCR